MSAATLSRNASMPRRPDAIGAGLALSLLVHAGLIASLAFSLNWHSRAPDAVEAELWAAVPEVPVLRNVAPEPAPVLKTTPIVTPPRQSRSVEADITIEKARRAARKLDDDKKRAALREQQEQEEKEEDTRLSIQREANLKRILGQAGAIDQPDHSAGPSASYTGRIKARIKPNIVYTEPVVGDLVTEVEVRCALDGVILSRRLVSSSGTKAWDEAVLRAIDKTETLPRDVDGRVPSLLIIGFNAHDF